MMDKEIDSEFRVAYAESCSRCQGFFVELKGLCATCKAPCFECSGRSTCAASTDTCGFEKYLESLARKPKHRLKFKTVGTDTCDLESHFDYYNVGTVKVIQKSVATDCIDLNYRKYSDRGKRTAGYRGKCEFPKKEEAEAEEEEGCFGVVKSEEDKENWTRDLGATAKEVSFEESSASSDESDIDLVTSCKVTRCRKIARAYRLGLTEVDADSEKAFKCSACGDTFPKKYLGVLHLGSHVDGDRYRCLSCESRFSCLEELMLHVTEAHRGVGTNNSDGGVKSEKGFAPKAVEKVFQCVLCLGVSDAPARFPSYKALYLHKRLKHGVKETKSRGKIERKPRLKREFICLFCGKEFKSNKALSDHLPVHTGEKNYLCDICNKSYTTSANLQIHKRTHVGLKNFKCTLCDKAFHKKDSLKVHFRKHSGERPFQCDLCPMRFDRNFILKNHRLRHFSEKTYICPVCGKAFTTHGGLNNHEKSHKRDPGSKKPRKPAVKPTLDKQSAVICDVCGKVYSTRSNLRIHKFVHLGVKPFQCPVCQQSYAKKDSMLTHMRKHTDERPFSCETCGMAFYRNHTLKTHRLRHTGERPHKCHMCGKSFTQSSSLTYHIKHHNRKEEKKKKAHAEDGSKAQRKKKPGKSAKEAAAKDLSIKCEDSDRPHEMIVVGDENGLAYAPDKPPLVVPVIKEEVLILDESLTIESVKKEVEPELFEVGAEGSQFSLNKFYIAKTKEKGCCKESQPGEPQLIVAKNNCNVTKDGNLLMMNRELWTKGMKELEELGEARADKGDGVLPIAGEILNAAFISDELIPFGPMTLQSVNAENIMISPLIKVEGEGGGGGGGDDRRKALPRASRLTVIDSKVKYHAGQAGKSVAKANCQILNLKDSRMQQRIQLINEPLSFHIQVPVSCTAVGDDGVLNGLAPAATYYG